MNLKVKNIVTTLKTKLIFLCLILLALPSLVIGITGYQSSKANLDQLGETNLTNNVNMAIKLIENLNQEVEKGALSLEEAQERAKVALIGEKGTDGKREIDKSINMGEYGYFFAMDEKGELLAHPNSEGNNLFDSVDPNGVNVGEEIVDAAFKGDGYAYYQWPLPNDPDSIKPKVTFAKKEENWGWVVSAGTYMMDFNSGANSILYVLLITLGISLVVGSVVAWFFSGRIANPIREIAHEMTLVAEGDLTIEKVKVKSNDEVGSLADSFNKMVENLKDLIMNVVETSEQVAASSEQLSANADETSKATEQIAGSMQDVAAGAEEQTNRVEKSTQFTKEISNDMLEISDQVERVTEATNFSLEQSEKGKEIVKQAITQMGIINSNTAETGSVIQLLHEKSSEIEKIVSLIKGIAEQTNLLALNAAIEAARAGEHGKGFAVVADEVRKLAEQSSESTQQINGLIKDIQASINKAVESTKNGENALKTGTELVNTAGSSFGEIGTAVVQVVDRLKDVTSSMNQINEGTSNLVETMVGVNEITAKTSGYTHEVASATEEQTASIEEVSAATVTLAQTAQELQSLARQFKI
ncbi:methyl-accepting chemotaxis protein [Bacillus sp. CECT 9360]|uniref:methyl-accepting chemotaxis protein n=1 Tax=Bacillus sp. CECT 9360 TaxID=2845821 RepID=UPI001E5A7B91|nr:methyl-accepting chemotaxis protein [Bacillus sp. CECT 9360]CAH0344749.1 Methyl-accepting chemotaxis protein McpB [Bacillus sp. CECT 9360]